MLSTPNHPLTQGIYNVQKIEGKKKKEEHDAYIDTMDTTLSRVLSYIKSFN